MIKKETHPMGKHILVRLTGDFLIICLLIFINYLVKNDRI